jgi:hypothetical protein
MGEPLERMTRRLLTVVVYVVLLAVGVSCFRSVWVGMVARPQYEAVFPGARGGVYWATQGLSLAAGVNSILIGLRRRWAIMVNPAIGLLSIVAIEMARGPRANEGVVLVACSVSTVLAWHLWGTPARSSRQR